MKPHEKILTYEQAKELKWFCNNVTGLRQEFYPLLDRLNAFNGKLERLERTCQLIEKFFSEHPNEKYYSAKEE